MNLKPPALSALLCAATMFEPGDMLHIRGPITSERSIRNALKEGVLEIMGAGHLRGSAAEITEWLKQNHPDVVFEYWANQSEPLRRL